MADLRPCSLDWLSGVTEEDVEASSALREAFRHLQLADAEIDHFQSIRLAMEDAAAAEDDSRRAFALSPEERRQLIEMSDRIIERFHAIHETLQEEPDPWLHERAADQARLAFGSSRDDLRSILSWHFQNMAAHQSSIEAKISFLERAIPYRSAGDSLPSQLTQLYLQSGLVARGVERIAPLVQRFPGDAALLQAAGILLAAGKDYPRAEALLARALEAARDDRLRSEIHYNLGYACELTGRIAQGIRHYEEALSLHPENAKARQGLERLRQRAR
jgi:tetratricopeptide (TPR) repeat protein